MYAMEATLKEDGNASKVNLFPQSSQESSVVILV